mmetsp:Transcript_19855/g.42313  ORF Transcript_19855/g.42313 Transcript_19855/m.42313 type:complete len:200 (-) Transcript_19855:92-691(-)
MPRGPPRHQVDPCRLAGAQGGARFAKGVGRLILAHRKLPALELFLPARLFLTPRGEVLSNDRLHARRLQPVHSSRIHPNDLCILGAHLHLCTKVHSRGAAELQRLVVHLGISEIDARIGVLCLGVHALLISAEAVLGGVADSRAYLINRARRHHADLGLLVPWRDVDFVPCHISGAGAKRESRHGLLLGVSLEAQGRHI